jgi:hypothetical protein
MSRSHDDLLYDGASRTLLPPPHCSIESVGLPSSSLNMISEMVGGFEIASLDETPSHRAVRFRDSMAALQC